MVFIKNWKYIFVIVSMVLSALIIFLNLKFGIIHQNNIVNIIVYLVLIILLIINMKLLKKIIINKKERYIYMTINIVLLCLVLGMVDIYRCNFHRLRYENEYIINDSERLVAVHFDTNITNMRSYYFEVRYEKQLAPDFKCYVLLDTIEYDRPYFYEINLEEVFSKINKIKNKGICYNNLRISQVSKTNAKRKY